MSSVLFYKNKAKKDAGKGASLEAFSDKETQLVRNFHKSFSQYSVTPLESLPHMAKRLNLANVFIKDESKRFGLNAFKVLGGSYAIGRLLAERLDIPLEKLSMDILTSDETRKKLGDITFATATDGNHGRGVAWTAQQLGQKAVVYMPKGSSKVRVENIRATGAECHVTEFNYDEAVRIANTKAEENGWIMVQDTAWEGYEDIPRWIMQGYMTLGIEALEQFKERGIDGPTHVFLQAGVGSYAGAVLGFLTKSMGDKYPLATIVEPHKANCIYKSMTAEDGKPHNVTGDLDTLMAGLACGEPSTISWDILRDYAYASISCPDYIAANGSRILSSPLGDDPRVIAGESGAVGFGILDYIMRSDNAAEIRKNLKLDENSQVLLISTEGDTSPRTYQDMVWYGKYPNQEEE